MASLIDELRETTKVAEEENRQKEKAQKEEADRERDRRNTEHAQAVISRLPEKMMSAAKEGRRQMDVVFADSEDGRRVMWQVENWCRQNHLQGKAERRHNPNDENSFEYYLTISWPDEPSGK